MHIKVNDILAQEVGYQTDLEIANESLEADELTLSQPVSGDLSLIRAEDSILSKGRIETAAKLECHRCLRAFNYPLQVKLSGEFSFTPSDERWPIENYTIDLAPMMLQELILALPIKQLCEADCPGLCLECGQRLDDEHQPHSKKAKENHGSTKKADHR